MVNKIYTDFDGVICNLIAKTVSLYNEDYKYYPGFKEIEWSTINTWGFEELTLAKKKDILKYFNQPRFFDNLEYMPWAKMILEQLSEEYEICVVTLGQVPNLTAKEEWIRENLPFMNFVGLNSKEHDDKRSVNMSDGIFIDDHIKNLESSNAKIKICFGDIYPWNEKWDGVRCANWHDVKNYLEKNNVKEDT